MGQLTSMAKWAWSRIGDLSTLQWLFPGGAVILVSALSYIEGLPYALWVIAALAAFILALIVLILWEEWRKGFRRGRHLYLSLPNFEGDKSKMVVVSAMSHAPWLEFRGDGPFTAMPPEKPLEPRPTITVLNAGPGQIRHLKVDWEVVKADFQGAFDAGLLGSVFVDLKEEGRLHLGKDGHVTQMPLASIASSVIPVLPEGESIKVEAPHSISYGVVINLLRIGKLYERNRKPLQYDIEDPKAMLEALEQGLNVRPLRGSLTYRSGNNAFRQEFRILAKLRPCGKVSRLQNANGDWFDDPDGECVALFDFRIVHD